MNQDDKPYENKELDVVIYPLKQIMCLLTSCNPNILEILGTKAEHIMYLSEEGKMLRGNADLFLSKAVYDSFGGYALSQLRRLENALARDSYPEGRKEEHIKGAIDRAMVSFNKKYKDIGSGINIYIDGEKELLLDIRNGRYTYEEIFQIVNDYEEKFKCAYLNTVLPDEPNYSKINELIIEINKKVLSR